MECNALNIKTAAKIPQKFLYLNQATKKYLPNFLAPKNPRIENFKPKKILQSSPSLEFWRSPLGIHTTDTSKAVIIKCSCGHSQEGVIYERFQYYKAMTGKILGFG